MIHEFDVDTNLLEQYKARSLKLEGDYVQLMYIYTDSMLLDKIFLEVRQDDTDEEEYDEDGNLFVSEDGGTQVRVFWYNEISSYEFFVYDDLNREVSLEELEPYIGRALESLVNGPVDAIEALRAIANRYTVSLEVSDARYAQATYERIVKEVGDVVDEFHWNR